jgi:hypothetical protein
LPPTVGQRATVANAMPPTRTSSEKRALPSIFAGRSSRGIRWPTNRNSVSGLSFGAAGTV